MMFRYIRWFFNLIRLKVFACTLFACIAASLLGFICPHLIWPPLNIIAQTIFYILAACPILQFVYVAIWNIRQSIKVKAARKNAALLQPSAYPDLVALALRMSIHLDEAHPFLSVGGLNNFTIDLSTKQLLIDTNLFEQFTPDEQLAVAAHEYAHVQKKYGLTYWHYRRFFLCVILVAIIFCFLYLLNIRWLFLTPFPALLILIPVIGHINEYEADKIAASMTSRATMITALKKLDPPSNWDREYLTHPSINRRIEKLLKS